MCIIIPNFIEISPTVADISHLTVLKMAAWLFNWVEKVSALVYQIALKIKLTVAKIRRLIMFFRDGGRPPSCICWRHFGTTHEEYATWRSSSLCRIWLLRIARSAPQSRPLASSNKT